MLTQIVKTVQQTTSVNYADVKIKSISVDLEHGAITCHIDYIASDLTTVVKSDSMSITGDEYRVWVMNNIPLVKDLRLKLFNACKAAGIVDTTYVDTFGT